MGITEKNIEEASDFFIKNEWETYGEQVKFGISVGFAKGVEWANERMKPDLESGLIKYKLLAGEACFETLKTVNDKFTENDRHLNVSEWIDIKVRQPEVGQFVLTYVPSIDMICRDQYREFETLGNKRDFAYRGVTHWMLLPEKPKQ